MRHCNDNNLGGRNYNNEKLSGFQCVGGFVLGGIVLFMVVVFLTVVESTPVVSDAPTGRVGVNSSGLPDGGYVLPGKQ